MLRQVAAAHHLVELEHQAVLWVGKRVARALHILHLHAVRHLPIEIEFDGISSLQDTVGMELALRRGSVAVHHTLVLLGLLGVTDPGGVDIAHQEARVVTLGFEHINFTVTGPAALGTGSPEGRPGRTRGRKLDARLGVETSARRGIQHSAIFCLGRDHARRERRIVHSAAILARAWDLRAVPLGLRRGVPGRQVQIAILNRDVLRAIGVIHLRTLRRIEAAVLIAPLRGIERVAVELVVPRHLVATGHRRGQRCSARSAICPLYSSRRSRCSRHGHHCNRCTHCYSQSCHHRQLAQARSLRSGGLTRDLHRDHTSLSCCIGLVIDHDHWRPHAKTEQTVSACRPMALYRITYHKRSRNHIHVDHNNSRANPRTQAPVSGGFSFGAVSAVSLNGSDPEQLSNDAGSFVVIKAPAYRYVLLGFS